jgi:hypothetical protein
MSVSSRDSYPDCEPQPAETYPLPSGYTLSPPASWPAAPLAEQHAPSLSHVNPVYTNTPPTARPMSNPYRQVMSMLRNPPRRRARAPAPPQEHPPAFGAHAPAEEAFAFPPQHFAQYPEAPSTVSALADAVQSLTAQVRIIVVIVLNT